MQQVYFRASNYDSFLSLFPCREFYFTTARPAFHGSSTNVLAKTNVVQDREIKAQSLTLLDQTTPMLNTGNIKITH